MSPARLKDNWRFVPEFIQRRAWLGKEPLKIRIARTVSFAAGKAPSCPGGDLLICKSISHTYTEHNKKKGG